MSKVSTDTHPATMPGSAEEETTQHKRMRSDYWRRSIGQLTLLACVPTVLAVGARWHWLLELCTHFRFYYVMMLLAGCLLCFLLRQHRAGLVTAAVMLWNISLIAPLYFGGPAVAVSGGGNVAEAAPSPAASPPASHASNDAAATGKSRTIRGITINVQARNRSHDEVLSYIREENPDFVVCIEVTQAWMKSLSSLEQEYPYHASQLHGGNFGMALFSRLPAESIDMRYVGNSKVPTVVARLMEDSGGGSERSFTVIGTHPVPPASGLAAQRRNEQLVELAATVQEIEGPVLLMGDLNTTSWSPYFQDMLESTNLRDGRLGFGMQGTWAPRPFLPRIPIDHVLASAEIVIRDHRVGRYVGSDHWPVAFDFLIEASRSDGS